MAEIQGNERYMLLGPSWAWSSFEVGNDDNMKEPAENYSDLWGIPYVNLSQPAFDNDDILEKRFLTHQSELPVIWFWSCNKYDIANMSAGNFFQHYASGQDEMQKKIISKIGDRKVLIVGSHSNPPKEGWPSNVKILSTSCQQRLNELADTNIPILEYEALHRYWKQGYVDKPSKEFVHLLHNGFEGWRYWRRLGWFTECHPTKKFVELFASETKNEVEQFLSDNEREQHDRR